MEKVHKQYGEALQYTTSIGASLYNKARIDDPIFGQEGLLTENNNEYTNLN